MAKLASYGYDASGGLIFFLLTSDLTHGVVERHSQNLNEEVDGIAGKVALGSAPVALLDDEADKGGQIEVARVFFDELQSALLQQGNQWHQPGRADLLASPADATAQAMPSTVMKGHLPGGQLATNFLIHPSRSWLEHSLGSQS